jgi:3'-phosphoadenosine 5'-phosphosulfate sulfotransferase
MSYYTELLITPKNFNKRNAAEAIITMEYFPEVLLTGTVYNTRCEALEGAVVRIKSAAPLEKKNLGYVITNQFGEFAIVVEKNEQVNYQFDIYEPVLTS